MEALEGIWDEGRRLVYLDNAATSFPKPEGVIRAMNELMINYGGNAGRGSHRIALAAAERVYECREHLSRFFDAEGAEQVCFCMNTTEALNMAIKGLLRRTDHVLISDMEHNSVLRPIYKLWSEGYIEYDVFPSLALDEGRTPTKICAEIAKRLRKNTRMLVCTGASNICSMTMPLAEIGEFCRKNQILFVVDGAQCAGHMPISLKNMNIDALCVPAHKGLLGAQGCGAVIFGKRIRGRDLRTIVEGGNGIASLSAESSGELPERLEAGTLPIPAIEGLSQSLRILDELGIERIAEHERALFALCKESLERLGRVKIYCPQYEGAVLLFNVDGISSEELAARLDEQGICTRGGYHCAALAHKTLGTDGQGALRVSFGVFNSSDDVRALERALVNICAVI